MQIWQKVNNSSSISSFKDFFISIIRRKKICVLPVRNGHQSGYSRADTIDKNPNKRSKEFSIKEKY